MIKCKYCQGETDFYIRHKGPHIGAYCSTCGKYIKWLNEREIAYIEHLKDVENFKHLSE